MNIIDYYTQENSVADILRMYKVNYSISEKKQLIADAEDYLMKFKSDSFYVILDHVNVLELKGVDEVSYFLSALNWWKMEIERRKECL